MTSSFIGIDLGGSSLKAVRVDQHGRILRQHTAAAGGKIPRQELVCAIRTALQAVSEGSTIKTAGLCFGGAIQPDGMMLPSSTNLPNIANLPLLTFFETELGCGVRTENDARAAMRGEAWSGAARGVKSAITITFGTGIGSGLMLDRKIVSGSRGRAGEIGVWKLNDAPAGPWLTFEETSAPGRVEARTGKRFGAMFANGEAANMIAWIGRAIANSHLLLDLDAAVLLGGIMELGEPLRAAIDAAFKAACEDDYQFGFAILLGELGPFAGAVGAASLWHEGAL